ncbi:SRPBCC domain-containing protein [Asanoa sp. WMMD1127]|uniref:SRPBCC domain-containing protein n=1 Tax=Asanoa sp. WMMD1127 TaxID=3016107 RepID=UPI002417CDFD|nr:SRPBCC domain-containing protein [Asanoa sp. WMMD1127]MDG4823149.1 SRPBCC domain-containing protein [Asanoa sp. WMMD1127]
MEIVAEPGVPQVVVTREFAAPARKLLRAHTEPDLLARWLGPDWLKITVDVLEPRDGGRWRYTHTDPSGERYAFFGLYHGTPTTERIVQTYEFDHQPGVVYLNIITFDERGDRTVLRQNTVFPSVEDRDYYVRSGMEKGLRPSWDRLATLVTEGI